MPPVKVPIKVQRRSGFDWSHHNALNQLVGTITPICVDEVIPNTKVYLRYAMAGSMPPLASDCFMKVYYDVRAFFIPFRLLAGGFESWFSDYPYNVIKVDSISGQNAVAQQKGVLPYFALDEGMDFSQMLGRGTLADYLGYKLADESLGYQDKPLLISAMPFLAYHRVCNDFFRQSNITVPFFAKPSNQISGNNGSDAYFPAMSPYVAPVSGAEIISGAVSEDKDAPQFLLADGHSIWDLRQANYDYDYFTNSLPSAQLGSPLSVSTSGGSFTIASLRSANALQQFAELNALAGSDLVSTVKARYGANLSNGVAQKCIYLGGARINMATKSVDVQTPNSVATGNNPFVRNVGASGGKVYCQGSDVIIDGFTANEPGYIMVVGVIIPKVTYGSGVRRYLRHYIGAGSLVDMANPLLQNVGNQPIYQYELDSCIGWLGYEDQPFAYTDRYAEFMTHEDESHGDLSYNGSLQSFIAQRFFAPATSPVIGSNFLEIPKTALDNISAVTAAISGYGWFGQFAFDYKVSMPLAQYSLPSLQNPAYEHGKTVKIHRGGFRF